MYCRVAWPILLTGPVVLVARKDHRQTGQPNTMRKIAVISIVFLGVLAYNTIVFTAYIGLYNFIRVSAKGYESNLIDATLFLIFSAMSFFIYYYVRNKHVRMAKILPDKKQTMMLAYFAVAALGIATFSFAGMAIFFQSSSLIHGTLYYMDRWGKVPGVLILVPCNLVIIWTAYFRLRYGAASNAIHNS